MYNAHIEIMNNGMISVLIQWLLAPFRSGGTNIDWIR
jgi:hypothetical protein